MFRWENFGGPNGIPIVILFPQRPRGLGFLGRQAGKKQGMQPRPLPHTSVGEWMKMFERMKAFHQASQMH